MGKNHKSYKKKFEIICCKGIRYFTGILMVIVMFGCALLVNTQESQAANKVSISDLEKAANKYSFYENPYYLEGVQGLVDVINEICKEYSDKQSLEVLTMEEALKEGGVSRSLRKKILNAEGSNVFTNKNFVRVEEKEKRGLFSTKYYFEVSSEKKEGGTNFYLGKLKNNKPNGDGAIFIVSENGTKLVYAGKFKEGAYEGKGIKFSHGDLGTFIQEQGQFSKGYENGKMTCYYDSEIELSYEIVEETYLGYLQKLKESYGEIPSEIMESILTDSMAERMIVTSLYYADSISYDTVSVNQPVIKPHILYSGEMKNGVRKGKGKIYAGLGSLFYEGELKAGTFWGKGTLYYPLSKQIAYKGEFRNGKYHGKGTLYETDGSVRKKGKFSDEAPDTDEVLMSGIRLSDILSETEVFGLNDKLQKYVDDAIKKIEEEQAKEEELWDEEYSEDEWEDEYFEDEWEDEYSEDEWEDEYEDEYEDDSQEYILVNSSYQKISEEELYDLTAEECRIARNEIYARHGRIFSDESLQAYFESCSWYEGTTAAEEFSDDMLNQIEKENLQIIREYEEEMGYR
ncbi:MAG: YARHG domain-containing protein [Lachnospiraceae bacterium]|nr:YARHG domain-containing protein [Lachnospiraceae bacterium]